MRRMFPVVVCVAILGLVVVAKSTPQSVADEVIAVTKAQWAAEMQKNTAEALKNVADDYTEFNGDYSTRLEGKQIGRASCRERV